jgi:hypothetical protein
MGLARLLLLNGAGYDVVEDLKAYTARQCAFHVALLKDAGFVEAVIRQDHIGFPSGATIIRLTWQGFEFLELVKDPEVWRGTKKVFDKAVSWSMPVLMEWLKTEAKRHLGLP